MTTKIHQGVGLLITNNAFNQFYVQIKDEHYQFEAWRGACTFWGGAIEPEDATELIAVEREVVEEIPDAVPILANVPKSQIKRFLVDNEHLERPFELTLFEAIVTNEQLHQIANVKVLEGNGTLINRVDLLNAKWLWGMDFIFKEYLKLKEIL